MWKRLQRLNLTVWRKLDQRCEYVAVSVKAIHDLNETSIDKSSAEGSSERYKVSSVRDERVADNKMS